MTRFGGKVRALTCTNFMATSRNPFCSNRLMISPTSPRWTPSGLMAMKVRSPFPAMALRAGARREGTRGLKVGGGHGGTTLPRGTATECPTKPGPAPRNPARRQAPPPAPPMPLEREDRPGLTYPKLLPPLPSAPLPPEENAQEEAGGPQIPRPAQRRSRWAGGVSGAESPVPSGTGPGRAEMRWDQAG